MKKRVAFCTLGCKLNFSESSEIGRQLEEAGFERVPFGSEAEVTVIHSCTVTGSADRKTRQAVHRAVKVSPGGFIVAMGCLAQLKPKEIASWPGVDLVLGTHEKFNLPAHLKDITKKSQTEIHSCGLDENERFFPAHSVAERTRAFLKVQDGCDYPCSYCTIPAARGPSRNPWADLILEQARELASKGLKEVVLTGVNIGDFGKSTGESFPDLVRALDQVEGILRFRISSIEPNLLPDELIEFVAGSRRFAPHFHIPLQAGSDKILRLMRRRYNRTTFESRVLKIKEIMPDTSIGADIITGFPGETDEDFSEACAFVLGLPLSYLHVFTFSERDGTPAASMPGQVPHRIREERSHRLHEIGEEIKNRFYSSQLGQDRPVIFEQTNAEGLMTGFTDNYIEVAVPADNDYLHQTAMVQLLDLLPGPAAAGKIISRL
ncbi:MAG: tRNA (N(6)-L-threonylcarbamoyladenosine(37)-C(2))-methylthiotransferase MtaB [Bacteroidales bacterium]